MKEALTALGGKGGGKPTNAQVGGGAELRAPLPLSSALCALIPVLMGPHRTSYPLSLALLSLASLAEQAAGPRGSADRAPPQADQLDTPTAFVQTL